MKKFLLKTILVLSPAFLLVVGVNYFGDAANLFTEEYEKQIAKGLKSGYNVTNVLNYDDRLLQKYMIDSITCPDVAVFGSSRTMLINAGHFKNKTFLNNSVSGASLEDLLGIYEIYQKNNCNPKHIILGLDPWTLNVNNGQTRWTTLMPEYNAIYTQLEKKEQSSDIISTPKSKYLQIISPSYFQASLQKLKNTDLIFTKNNSNSTFTRLTDGSISYDEKFRNSNPAEIDAFVNDYLNGDIYSVERFDKISPELKNLLEKFIVLLKEKNVKVSILLAPYNPKVYSFIAAKDKYRQVMNSEKIYRALAKKHNIEIIGSFDPAALEMDQTYFYDGMHSNEKGVVKILDMLKQ